MDNLFLLLFFVSLVCLLIGLVKPTVFSRFIKGKITRKKIGLIFGITAFTFFVLFGVTTDTSNKNIVIENKEQLSEKENLTKPKIEKIENVEQRADAIKKVETTMDKDYYFRMAAGVTFADVYKNPKGEGIIVWIGDDRRPEGDFVYLVINNSVYGVGGNAAVLSPNIHMAENLTYQDLKEIAEMRKTDYKALLEACLKRVEVLKKNGLVEKRIEEEKNECYSKYKK